jgi:phenylpyruvate tautomerase PptA (4-oxalocrotonate tautomerase family)
LRFSEQCSGARREAIALACRLDAMPIIEIEALPPADPIDVSAALTHVAKAVAAHLDEDPRSTWVTFRPFAPGHFAEGEDAPSVQPEASHPALVKVLTKVTGSELQPLLEVAGNAVVDAFGLAAGNVAVRAETADPSRLYWG